MKFLISLLAFGLIIFLHELGHFLTAIYFNIAVKEFAIGFGPSIFTYHGKLTTYSLRIMPLGGYVDIDLEDKESSFNRANILAKTVVLLAGVIMNFLLAIIIFLGIFSYIGEIDKTSNIVNKSLTKKALLQINDQVISLNNSKISNWKELEEKMLSLSKELKNISLTVLRNKKNIVLNVKREDFTLLLKGAFPAKKSLFIVLKRTSLTFFKSCKESIHNIKSLLTGKRKLHELSGPIGIIKGTIDSLNIGFVNLLSLIAMISISVGFFNVIPFPPLDGGRLLLIALAHLGIRIPKKIEEAFAAFGFIIFLILTIIIGKNDVNKLMRKNILNKEQGK